MIARVARSLVAVLSIALAAHAFAEAVVPAKGQSADQVQRDIADCSAAATQSSGYTIPRRRARRWRWLPRRRAGACACAAVGAAASAAGAEVRGQQHAGYDALSDDTKQEYRRNQAKDGAVAGAVVGGSKQRRDRRSAAAQQNAQADAKANAHQQAYHGCLLGRGLHDLALRARAAKIAQRSICPA